MIRPVAEKVIKMRFLLKQRDFSADLKELMLKDILDRFQEENFFNSDQLFYLIEIVDNNHFSIGLPRDRVTSRQIHEFKYDNETKKMQVISYYGNLYFPGFFLSLLIFFGEKEQLIENGQMFLVLFIAITSYIFIIATISLRESSKNLEREVTIRANDLLRKKGYKVML